MNNTGSPSVYTETALYTCFKALTVPSLRPASLRCVASITRNFFCRQYRAALLPGRVPVSAVDHPLDNAIPFTPAWVHIYLDFIGFWLRMLAFLLRAYRRRAFEAVGNFIGSIGELYAFAAEVYRKHLSTTRRPFYIARPRFFLIHLTDPHLMCVPSLHVMVVVWTWLRFAAILRSLGDEERYAPQIEEMKQGALAITAAIIFVKQHSVNCIAASLYAMTCFDGELFPPEQAEAFAALLCGEPPPAPKQAARTHPSAAPRTSLPPALTAEIRAHVTGLYRRFLAARTAAASWDGPLLDFLRALPRVS